MWVIFVFLGLFVMFMYWNIIELNLTQRPRNAFLLAMILIERVGGVWIWKQRRLLYLVMWCLMKFQVTKTMQMAAKVQLLLHSFVMILPGEKRFFNCDRHLSWREYRSHYKYWSCDKKPLQILKLRQEATTNIEVAKKSSNTEKVTRSFIWFCS